MKLIAVAALFTLVSCARLRQPGAKNVSHANVSSEAKPNKALIASAQPVLGAINPKQDASYDDSVLRSTYSWLVSEADRVQAMYEEVKKLPNIKRKQQEHELTKSAKEITDSAARLERRARIVLGAKLKASPPSSTADKGPLAQLEAAHEEVLQAAASVELVRQHAPNIAPAKLHVFVASIKQEPEDMEAEIAEAKEEAEQLEEKVEKTEDKLEEAKDTLEEKKEVEEKAEAVVEKVEKANETKAEEAEKEGAKEESKGEAKVEKLGNETKVNETEAKVNETKAEEEVEEAKEEVAEAKEEHEEAKEALKEHKAEHKEMKSEHKTLVSTWTMVFFVVVGVILAGCLYKL